MTAACQAVAGLTWTSYEEYETTGEVYVKGKICKISNTGTYFQGGTFGNANFYIKDDDGDAELMCYRILYLGNKKYQDGQTDIKVGDEVVICGLLMNFRGKTPETVENKAYLYSLNGKTEDGGGGGGNAGTPSGDGTLSNPYNVTAACEAVAGLTWTSNKEYETTGEVYVTGKISKITNTGTYTQGGTFGNANFYIKDDDGDAELMCYRILYLGNKKYQDGQTDIEVGDEVIICGLLMNFRGNTPETVENKAYLYSLNGMTYEDLGIDGVNQETLTNNRYYSIDGKRIDGKPMQKGLYINKGKTVVVK